MSLRVRLGLLYGSLLAATLMLFAALLYGTLRNSLSAQVDAQLAARAEQVAAGLRLTDPPLDPSDVPPGRLGVPPLESAGAQAVVVQVLDDRGRVLASSDPGLRTPLAPSLLAARAGDGDRVAEVAGPDGAGWRVLAHPVLAQGQPAGTVLAAASLAPIRATMARVLQLLAFAGLLALAAASVIGWALAGRALAPLERITRTARAIARTGELRERLAMERRRDEVGQLASAFNAMIERLDEAARRQRAFLADTSHELRSPLTVLRGNLDLIRRDPDPAARLEYLADADIEARRMARLVDDLLLLAQSDASQSVERQRVALADVCRAVYEQALMLAEGPRVELQVVDSAWVLGDADRLKQLIWNLVDNALRHTPNDGSVTISLHAERDQAVVRVADTGVGIAAEHLPRIFDRFYKVDRARSRGRGGTGLGLSIVRYLAEAHGGTVDVESEVGVGTAFTLRLPLATASTGPAAPRAAESPADAALAVPDHGPRC